VAARPAPTVKKFEDIFIRFDTTHERDIHTHRQTRTHTDRLETPRGISATADLLAIMPAIFRYSSSKQQTVH